MKYLKNIMDSNIAVQDPAVSKDGEDDAKNFSIGLLPEDTRSHLPLRVMLIA